MKWNLYLPIGAFIISSMLTGFEKDYSLNLQEKAVKVNDINHGNPALFVQYESKGNNVFVECVVTGITFREKNQENEKAGKMIVWVDGKKSQEVSAAAFIIKDLPKGNHKLKLEVVDLKNKPFGLTKEFMVNIPNR